MKSDTFRVRLEARKFRSQFDLNDFRKPLKSEIQKNFWRTVVKLLCLHDGQVGALSLWRGSNFVVVDLVVYPVTQWSDEIWCRNGRFVAEMFCGLKVGKEVSKNFWRVVCLNVELSSNEPVKRLHNFYGTPTERLRNRLVDRKQVNGDGCLMNQKSFQRISKSGVQKIKVEIEKSSVEVANRKFKFKTVETLANGFSMKLAH